MKYTFQINYKNDQIDTIECTTDKHPPKTINALVFLCQLKNENKGNLVDYVNPLSYLKDTWLSDEDIKEIANEFKNFFTTCPIRVLYYIEENRLIFSEMPSTQAPLYEFFPYTKIYKTFYKCTQTLQETLLGKINLRPKYTFLQKTYIHSEEFLSFHLSQIIQHYMPQFAFSNPFQATKSNVATLLNELPDVLSHRTNSVVYESLYKVKKDDFYRIFLLEHSSEFLNFTLAKYWGKENLQNRYKGLLLLKTYYEKTLEAPSSFIISLNGSDALLTYDSITSKEKKQTKKERLFLYHAYLYGISPKELELISFVENNNKSLLLDPLTIPDVDTLAYFKKIQENYNYQLYDDVLSFYKQEHNNFESSYIRTNSLGTVLVEAIRALKSEQATFLRECPACEKFFIAKSNYYKYCSPKCSDKGKKTALENLPASVKKLHNLRRDKQQIWTSTCQNYATKIIATSSPSEIVNECRFFVFFLLQGILLNLYDKEKKFILNTLRKCTAEKASRLEEQLISYGKSFFLPGGQRKFTLPGKNDTEYVFYPSVAKIVKDDTYSSVCEGFITEHATLIFSFHWKTELENLLNNTTSYISAAELKEAIMNFKKWLEKLPKEQTNIEEVQTALSFIRNIWPTNVPALQFEEDITQINTKTRGLSR